MRDLTSDDTLVRRAKLYSAVVDGAINALNRIDEGLRVTRAEVSTLQENRDKATADLANARDDLKAAASSVDELTAQRDVIADRLAWLEEVAGRPVLTGREGTNPDRPVLAVKIDNVRAAWPQIGINQADIVFEEQVEGGLSRLVALFHSRIPETVGPVRSVRTTDVNLLANLDEPLFSHSGGNDGTTSALAASSLVNVGHPAKPELYYRDSGRSAPHNLLTSPADLLNSASGGRPPALFSRP
ncbi:MAG: DUF3048 domain-containing protein, partial [Acidobacteria bacterium]|nr:DUF3048 domain-containing protein [Acidobacteriota bacterium]